MTDTIKEYYPTGVAIQDQETHRQAEVDVAWKALVTTSPVEAETYLEAVRKRNAASQENEDMSIGFAVISLMILAILWNLGRCLVWQPFKALQKSFEKAYF